MNIYSQVQREVANVVVHLNSSISAQLAAQLPRSSTIASSRKRSTIAHINEHINRTRVNLQQRHASSSSRLPSSSSSSSTKPSQQPPKHTVLEQPETFRPPSHGSRLRSKARSTTASYGSYGVGGNYSYAGGYNQGTNEQEREQQKTRKYPNMFPNEGTLMHWFLTNRSVHLWISLGTLSLLSIITLSQTFLKTSPFSHLLPPLSSLLWHPIDFIRDTASTIRLHIDYTSEQTAEKRRQNILDAQKRRLYRRAHGLEDLNKDEGEGIDVTGLVEWDDGLTGPERERKLAKLAKLSKQSGDGVEHVSSVAAPTDSDTGEDGQQQQQQQHPRRKVKRWLGIWE